MKKVFILFFILIFMGAGAASFSLWYFIYYPLEIDGKSEFPVKTGDSVGKIAARLESGDYIRSALFFKLYVRYRGGETRIRTGEYPFDGENNVVDIYEWFIVGNETLTKVTLKEGLTLRQTAIILEENGICSALDFTASANNPVLVDSLGIPANNAEGFLFPDTYHLREESTGKEVLVFLVESFFDHLKLLYPSYSELSQDKLKEKIILASIIEKEYRREEEASRIASVFYNRLDSGMKLQSCATVVYAITEEYGKDHPSRLFYSDLEIDSEYNTYQQAGLPVGPIASPGETALKAAFYPEETSYLFFVVEDLSLGSHRFTTNLDDHNKAAGDYINSFTIK